MNTIEMIIHVIASSFPLTTCGIIITVVPTVDDSVAGGSVVEARRLIDFIERFDRVPFFTSFTFLMLIKFRMFKETRCNADSFEREKLTLNCKILKFIEHQSTH